MDAYIFLPPLVLSRRVPHWRAARARACSSSVGEDGRAPHAADRCLPFTCCRQDPGIGSAMAGLILAGANPLSLHRQAVPPTGVGGGTTRMTSHGRVYDQEG